MSRGKHHYFVTLLLALRRGGSCEDVGGIIEKSKRKTAGVLLLEPTVSSQVVVPRHSVQLVGVIAFPFLFFLRKEEKKEWENSLHIAIHFKFKVRSGLGGSEVALSMRGCVF